MNPVEIIPKRCSYQWQMATHVITGGGGGVNNSIAKEFCPLSYMGVKEDALTYRKGETLLRTWKWVSILDQHIMGVRDQWYTVTMRLICMSRHFGHEAI